ncbi:carbohydrate deacetylase [Lacticaseibacillus daqingensis]|uniref:carbohydrate deacetylase n=1 Tax=Lacticaseibacillus daqingensis TaxID=2486014 RepID=UPI000F782F79|nr:carbohydrate deacetylase [Lacticaseibacillus daqingensis]
MTQLIINADDFGYSRAVSYGILTAYKSGVLTSTTMMANMPGFAHAQWLVQGEPGLAIGVHLTLTAGKPLVRAASSLTDGTDFRKRQAVFAHPEVIDPDELYEEWDAQIVKVAGAGIPITHLDSHHYVHGIPAFAPVITALAEKYALPVRNNFTLVPENVRTTTALWKIFNFAQFKDMTRSYGAAFEDIMAMIQKDAAPFVDLATVEANCHPGYVDETLLYGSSFNLPRMREVTMLCDPRFKAMLEQAGFTLTTYRSL